MVEEGRGGGGILSEDMNGGALQSEGDCDAMMQIPGPVRGSLRYIALARATLAWEDPMNRRILPFIVSPCPLEPPLDLREDSFSDMRDVYTPLILRSHIRFRPGKLRQEDGGHHWNHAYTGWPAIQRLMIWSAHHHSTALRRQSAGGAWRHQGPEPQCEGTMDRIRADHGACRRPYNSGYSNTFH